MDLALGQCTNHTASVKGKVFRLLNQARPVRLVGFGRINQKEVKDVFFGADAGVKTISIIGGIEDETTIECCGLFTRTDSCQPNAMRVY